MLPQQLADIQLAHVQAFVTMLVVAAGVLLELDSLHK